MNIRKHSSSSAETSTTIRPRLSSPSTTKTTTTPGTTAASSTTMTTKTGERKSDTCRTTRIRIANDASSMSKSSVSQPSMSLPTSQPKSSASSQPMSLSPRLLLMLLLVCCSLWLHLATPCAAVGYSYARFVGPVRGPEHRVLVNGGHGGHGPSVDYVAKPDYEFAYGVEDGTTRVLQNRKETRDGDAVHGVYSLVDPDGSLRVVKYTADDVHGFRAEVITNGIAEIHSHDSQPGSVGVGGGSGGGGVGATVETTHWQPVQTVHPPPHIGQREVQHEVQHVGGNGNGGGNAVAVAVAGGGGEADGDDDEDDGDVRQNSQDDSNDDEDDDDDNDEGEQKNHDDDEEEGEGDDEGEEKSEEDDSYEEASKEAHSQEDSSDSDEYY